VGASALRLEGALAEAAAHVRRTAHAAGKHVGIYGGSAAYARDRADEGFDLVVPFTDWACLVGGAQEAVGAFGGGREGENEGGGYGGR
jgi:2-keto-3-deoxy-L-rhamnonate aldolase RhmA